MYIDYREDFVADGTNQGKVSSRSKSMSSI